MCGDCSKVHIYSAFSRPQAWNMINYTSAVLMNLLRARDRKSGKICLCNLLPRILLLHNEVGEEGKLINFFLWATFLCWCHQSRTNMKRSYCARPRSASFKQSSKFFRAYLYEVSKNVRNDLEYKKSILKQHFWCKNMKTWDKTLKNYKDSQPNEELE